METEPRPASPDQEFDLIGVNTVLASRFRRRRQAFLAIGLATMAGLIFLGVWFAIFGGQDALTTGLILLWIAALVWYSGAYGFGNAIRLSPGPIRLSLGQEGISLTFIDGGIRFWPWAGGGIRIRLGSRRAHVDGIPDYSLLVAPRLRDLLPPYGSIVPLTPLTSEAHDALLAAARNRGITGVAVPTSRFLGVDAPGTAHLFELPRPAAEPRRW
ncbi:MAG: hypothetical protein L3J96_02310 [Thermoplasmata archaeon]|nr:hypothetical protein [Thermoplasmata archaeon]